MEKFKAVYKNKVYEVRAINWDIQYPTGQNGEVTLAKNIMTTESEYLYSSLDNKNLKILRPVAKDKKGLIAYEGDIIKRTVFYDYEGVDYLTGDTESNYLNLIMVGVLHFTASNGAIIRNARVWKTSDPYESLKLQEGTINARYVQGASEVIGNIYETPELLEKDFTEEDSCRK